MLMRRQVQSVAFGVRMFPSPFCAPLPLPAESTHWQASFGHALSEPKPSVYLHDQFPRSGPSGFAPELNTAPAPKNCSTQLVEVWRPDTGPVTVSGTSVVFGVFHEDQNSISALPPENCRSATGPAALWSVASPA